MLLLYENIKKRRQALGISQEELAERLGYNSRSTIAKIEAGVNDITQSKIIAFARALKCTPAYLMGWETDTTTDERTETTSEVSQKEQKHLDRYRELNTLGQDKADEYISDLTENPKYKK